MSHTQADLYYKQLKNALVSSPGEALEQLLFPKSIPPAPEDFYNNKAATDRALSDKDRQLISMVDKISQLSSASALNLVALYDDLLTKAAASSILNDESEFKEFFRALFKKLRQDLRRLGLISEEKLAGTISAVRELFVSQKRAKLMGTLPCLLHQLLFLYFATKQFQQCSKFMETVAPILKHLLSQAGRLESLNINYYLGRLDHFRDNYDSAEEKFEEALELAFNNRQRRRILVMLIPLKMNRDVYPTKRLLRVFRFTQLEELTSCIKQGDMVGFEELIARNLQKWVKSGIFFMLNQCKQVLLTNLLRRVYKEVGADHKLSMRAVETALNFNRDRLFSRNEIIAMVSGVLHSGRANAALYADTYVLHFNHKKSPFN